MERFRISLEEVRAISSERRLQILVLIHDGLRTRKALIGKLDMTKFKFDSEITGTNKNSGPRKLDYKKYYDLVALIFRDMRVNLHAYHIDEYHWTHFNELRDRGMSLLEIRNSTEMVSLPAIYMLESARRCIIKHDGDANKVRECLEGRIDP